MAERVDKYLIDDLDETGQAIADSTVAFSVGGSFYEIDLCKANEERLHDALALFTDHARPVEPSRLVVPKGSSAPKSSKRTAAARQRSAEIRRWAVEEKHYTLDPRGRIPASVIREYDACH